MSAGSKLKRELKSVALYTLFFGAWFAMFILVKKLTLAEYEVRFSGLSAAFVGALILAKVVLLLEDVSLGEGIARRPAWLEVVVRTVFYGFGVLVVLLLEKAFEVRHEKAECCTRSRASFTTRTFRTWWRIPSLPPARCWPSTCCRCLGSV